MGGGPSSSRQMADLAKSIEVRFTEMEEKLSEKANKQSVAQALHRKANKPELDAIIAKKVDFEDMQRILDQKVDLLSFQNIVRTLDFKADKHELVMASQTMASEYDKSELEKLFQILKQATIETDEKFNQIDNRQNDHLREVVQGLEKIRAEAQSGLQ